MFDEDIDLTDVPHLHRRVNRVPVDGVPIQGDQTYGVPSGADHEISAGGKQLCQRRRTGISAVSDKNVTLCYRQPGECLAAVRIGYIEIGEARPGRVVGSMHPEICASTSGPGNRIGIGDTKATATNGMHARGRGWQKGTRDLAQPISRATQTLQQGDIRNLCNVIQTSPGGSRAQAHSSRAVCRGQPDATG